MQNVSHGPRTEQTFSITFIQSRYMLQRTLKVQILCHKKKCLFYIKWYFWSHRTFQHGISKNQFDIFCHKSVILSDFQNVIDFHWKYPFHSCLVADLIWYFFVSRLRELLNLLWNWKKKNTFRDLFESLCK